MSERSHVFIMDEAGGEGGFSVLSYFGMLEIF